MDAITPVVLLSKEEVAMASRIGTARCDAKPSGIREHDSGYHSFNKDRAFPHRIGAAVELAYAKVTGKSVDQRIMETGDDTDFEGIETKGSTWEGDDIELKIKQSEYVRKSPIGYVLARVSLDLSRVEFIGSIARSRFDRIKYPKRHKYADNWCVEGKDLSKVLAVRENGRNKLIPLGASE